MQNLIDKIRDLVEDRQSWIESKTVNDVSRRKSTAKVKLKATSQEKKSNYENNISRIYSETVRKLHMNQSRELLVNN